MSRGWRFGFVIIVAAGGREGSKVERVERGEVPHPDVLVRRSGHEHAQVWNDVEGFDKVEVADGRREERFRLWRSGRSGARGSGKNIPARENAPGCPRP